MKIHSLISCTGLALAVLVTSNTSLFGQDDVGPARDLGQAYIQDFDSISVGTVSETKDESLFDADQWRVFGNVFSPSDAYLYGYGPFKAPNNVSGPDGTAFVGPGFTTVATGEPTTSGDNYLNVFSDYNNSDHGNGNIINAVIYQDFSVTEADVGETWSFDFDYRNATDGNGIADNSNGGTAGAFVKVLDQINGSFAEIDRGDFDTSTATDTFQPGSISFEIKQTHVGQALQIGFESFATNFDPSGVLYDTISFAVPSALLGDFNNDGFVNLEDLDQYNGNLGAPATGGLAALDLDGDNVVDSDDFEQHYSQLVETQNNGVIIAGTSLGDLNLDGKVDVLNDAFVLVDNLGNNAATSWAQGDLDANGRVDVLGDAFVLVENLGANNSVNGSAIPSAAAVPEPGSISLLGLVAAGLVARRRR